MYGTDTTQSAGLAAMGTALGVSGHVIAVGVLFMATLTLVTITRILLHRDRKTSQPAGHQGTLGLPGP
ncbi:hypothetical protein [Nesterenkonia suensis]